MSGDDWIPRWQMDSLRLRRQYHPTRKEQKRINKRKEEKMSLPISFTDKDLLRGKLVKPGWYRVRIDEISDSLSSKGDSTNYQVDYTIIKNADNGDEEFAGVPGQWWFNSKAMGFAKGYFEAFGISVTSGQRYDLKGTEGKELDVYVRNEMYNNRMTNKVNHEYRQPQS